MRPFYYTICFLLLLNVFLYSAAADEICATTTGGGSSVYAVTGGRYKPSANASGEFLRSLIVYVQFDDDITSIPNWNVNSLPSWAYGLIDNAPSSTYRSLTISDYFKNMSNGDFDFIGDVYPNLIRLPTTKNYGFSK